MTCKKGFLWHCCPQHRCVSDLCGGNLLQRWAFLKYILSCHGADFEGIKVHPILLFLKDQNLFFLKNQPSSFLKNSYFVENEGEWREGDSRSSGVETIFIALALLKATNLFILWPLTEYTNSCSEIESRFHSSFTDSFNKDARRLEELWGLAGQGCIKCIVCLPPTGSKTADCREDSLTCAEIKQLWEGREGPTKGG